MSLDLELKYRELTQKYGVEIIGLARLSIEYGLNKGKVFPIEVEYFPEEMQEEGASFVTIEKKGELRGCIGSIMAYRPLSLDIVENAYASAFRDNRFSPLSSSEIKDIMVSVSILTPSQVINFTNEADLLSQLKPNVDGVVIEDNGKRAVFLPVVWEHFDNKQDFLSHLKMKAGLAPDYFSKTFKASRFLSISIKQSDFELSPKVAKLNWGQLFGKQ